MAAPFLMAPHSVVMLDDKRALRLYLFYCATKWKSDGKSRWSLKRIAVKIGMNVSNLRKAEATLIEGGWLEKGKDARGGFWMPVDPSPINIMQDSDKSGPPGAKCDAEEGKVAKEKRAKCDAEEGKTDSGCDKSGYLEHEKPVVDGVPGSAQEQEQEHLQKHTQIRGREVEQQPVFESDDMSFLSEPTEPVPKPKPYVVPQRPDIPQPGSYYRDHHLKGAK